MKIAFRARRGDVKQSSFFFEIVKLVLKTVRGKPAVGHPDQENVVPFETFRRVNGRERNETAATPRRVSLDHFGRIERHVFEQLRGVTVLAAREEMRYGAAQNFYSCNVAILLRLVRAALMNS